MGGRSFDQMHLKAVFMSASVLVLWSLGKHTCVCVERVRRRKNREREREREEIRELGCGMRTAFERVTNMPALCNNVLLSSLYYLLTYIYVFVCLSSEL